MFRFGSPFYFLLLIPVAVACAWVYRSRRRQGAIFSATGHLPRGGASWRRALANALPLLVVAGLVLSVIALARPRTVFSKSRRAADAIAIEMVVDVSGSMEALDLSTKTATGYRYRTRLDVVKEMFAEFIAQRPDDLIGLVTFGGYATTRVPLTADHDALVHVLEGVEIPKASRDGRGRVVNQEELLTAIGDAVATGCARLKDSEPTSRILVLLSDGESNTGIIEPAQAASAAAKLGVKVYTIGVGTTGMAPFRGRDMLGRETIQQARVRLDEAMLKRIAAETGGQYFNVRDPAGLEKALADINELEKTEVERDVFYHYDEKFESLLLVAVGLIVVGAGGRMAIARRLV
jgi:Ca-activated chloride channel family protein